MYGGLQLLPEGACVLCHEVRVPVLIGAKQQRDAGVCEPCARLADWRFRSLDDAELAGVPFATIPGAALVLIFRDRLVDGHPDTFCPRDVLMVERKDEPGKWGLPGGKIESGEISIDAGVRELAEETAVRAWPTALDPLYCGFSARGRLVDAFLCRAYGGVAAQVDGEGAVEWKPWPPSAHAGALKGYYRGLEDAFELRLKLHKAIGNEPPLCQRLGRSAVDYVEEMLKGVTDDDGRRHMEALTYVMSEEEKLASKIVLHVVLAPKLPEAKERPPEPESDAEDDSEPVFGEDEERQGP